MKKNFLVALSLAGALCLSAPGMEVDAAWKITSSGRQYTLNDGQGYATGWKKIGNYWYYFNKEGYAQTGWHTIKKKLYFFDARGRMITNKWVQGKYLSKDGFVTKTKEETSSTKTTSTVSDTAVSVQAKEPVKKGWVEENGKYYYYVKGKKKKGWIRLDGKVYYLNPRNGIRLTGLRCIKNKYYYFDKEGIRITGWKSVKGKRYFFSRKNGTAVTGWTSIMKKYYYFNKQGQLQKNAWDTSHTRYADEKGLRAYGWKELSDGTYYFDPKTGIKTVGWRTIDGKKYLFTSTGALSQKSGIITFDKKKYYFNPTTGEQASGWQTINGQTYYFDPETGAACKGWVKIDGDYYYFSSKNVLSTGPRWINNYYIDAEGKRQTGWLVLDGKSYYLHSTTGKKITGWKTIKGVTYCFNKDGSMITDAWNGDRYLGSDGVLVRNQWVGAYYVGADGHQTGQTRQAGLYTDANGDTYCYDDNFQLLTGWQTVDGQVYYFKTEDGKMLKSTWFLGYYFQEDGTYAVNKFITVDNKTYYMQAGGGVTVGLYDVKGKTYYFNSDGVMMTGFVDIDGNSYYFSAKQNGAMVKSRTVTINKVTYNFDANGVATPVISKQDLAKGQAIVDYALQFVTTEENKDTNRYEYGGQWNGELPYTPTDCSGFTSGVMAHFGITIPRVAADQANGGTLGGWTTYAKAVTVSTSELLPGDLVFYYTPIGHVGIYIGDGKIVHASNSKDGIKISAYNYTTVVKCVRYWSTTK